MQERQPILDYATRSRVKTTPSPFMLEWAPTLGVFLAIIGIVTAFIGVGASVEVAPHLMVPTLSNLENVIEALGILVLGVLSAILGFRFICGSP